MDFADIWLLKIDFGNLWIFGIEGFFSINDFGVIMGSCTINNGTVNCNKLFRHRMT